MTKNAITPLGIITLSTSLVVLIREDANSAYGPDQWFQHIQSDNHLLALTPSLEQIDALTEFYKSHAGSDCRSVVICAPSISSEVTFISLHALETGYRVFVVALDLEDEVTPQILRLTNSGVNVLNRATFEAETSFI